MTFCVKNLLFQHISDKSVQMLLYIFDLEKADNHYSEASLNLKRQIGRYCKMRQ